MFRFSQNIQRCCTFETNHCFIACHYRHNRNFFSLFKKKTKETPPPTLPPRPLRLFDETMLQYIVCPLNKKTLRYDAEGYELVNDELGIAYPIRDGIPILLPQEARLIRDLKKEESTSSREETNV
jgi:uncharacterized protein YbaR (Trm112 family)